MTMLGKYTKVKQDLERQFRKSLNEGTLNQVLDDETKGAANGINSQLVNH